MQHVFVLAFVSALAVGLAATIYLEVRGVVSWLSWSLLKLAVRVIPLGTRRDEADEEWRATWETWGDGAFGRLVWGASLVVAGLRIGRRERREPSRAPKVRVEGVETLDELLRLAEANGWSVTRSDRTSLVNARKNHLVMRFDASLPPSLQVLKSVHDRIVDGDD